jgi:hypothetical protein
VRETAIVAAVALAIRAAIVAWAFGRFPPLADGTFYHLFATRLAQGLGYTVAWPDGVVTYAAHYPVGYPALLSIAYRVLGATPGSAMVVNAAIGTLAAVAAHRVALRELSPRASLACGLVVALHPSLVLYTPAVMTEGVAAALLVCAFACAPTKAAPRNVYIARIALMGAVFGLATLVRPQTLVFAPLLAYLATRRVVVAAAVLACTLFTVAPWTARNCVRMRSCALVSVNAGWNLLIGAQTNDGTWTPLESPDECKTVWDEAAKDACFERAARAEIARAPGAWLAKIPAKLATTFDVFAAGPFYMFKSNPNAFGDRAVHVWAAVEILFVRLLLAAGFVATAPIWRLRVSRKRLATTAPRFAVAAAGLVFSFLRTAWPAYGLFVIACLVRDHDERRSPIRAAAGVVVLLTMVTHAVFFGANRYGLLVVPFVSLAVFACVRPKALSPSLA